MKTKDGIIGLVVGDLLGVPVEFKIRKDLIKNPVTDMLVMGHIICRKELGLMIHH